MLMVLHGEIPDAKKYTCWHVKVYSDSELVINHIIGEYRIKASHLVQLCKEIYKLKNLPLIHRPNIIY